MLKSTMLVLMPLQNWSGIFRGPLVIQTFAYHFSALSGAVRVTGLYPDQMDTLLPRGSLALAATAVSYLFSITSFVYMSYRSNVLFASSMTAPSPLQRSKKTRAKRRRRRSDLEPKQIPKLDRRQNVSLRLPKINGGRPRGDGRKVPNPTSTTR